MNSLRSFISAIIILICGLVYVISPIDLLPGIPIDDIAVGIATIMGSIKEFKNAIYTIHKTENRIANLLLILIIVLIVILIVNIVL